MSGNSCSSKRVRGFIAAALAGALAACTAPDGVPPADREQTVQSLLQADRDFADSVTASRTEGWVWWFAADGVQLVPGGELRGHAAIRQAMAGAFADTSFSLTWEPSWGKASAGGDLGVTVGRYVSRRQVDGEPMERTGSYITVWERDDAGAWKVALDGGVPDEG